LSGRGQRFIFDANEVICVRVQLPVFAKSNKVLAQKQAFGRFLANTKTTKYLLVFFKNFA
jgi:hypothetical protein